jgi:hypothetical protein
MRPDDFIALLIWGGVVVGYALAVWSLIRQGRAGEREEASPDSTREPGRASTLRPARHVAFGDKSRTADVRR